MTVIAYAHAAATDECYRCGYPLVGIADDHPCPECGLLAQRSRRPGDELHFSRPKWLRRLSSGIWLMLAAGLSVPMMYLLIGLFGETLLDFVTPSSMSSWELRNQLELLPLDLAAVMIWLGLLLLSSAEGYELADRADRNFRRSLQILGLVPLVALILLHVAMYPGWSGAWRYSSRTSSIGWAAFAVATLGCTPLPILIAIRLRGLAKRARSAHLAEHCMIVGVGVALTLVYIFVVRIIFENAESWGWGTNWTGRGSVSLIVMLIVSVLSFLMILWNLYLLVRFAIAFTIAARRLRTDWRRDDRSQIAPTMPPLVPTAAQTPAALRPVGWEWIAAAQDPQGKR